MIQSSRASVAETEGEKKGNEVQEKGKTTVRGIDEEREDETARQAKGGGGEITREEEEADKDVDREVDYSSPADVVLTELGSIQWGCPSLAALGAGLVTLLIGATPSIFDVSSDWLLVPRPLISSVIRGIPRNTGDFLKRPVFAGLCLCFRSCIRHISIFVSMHQYNIHWYFSQ
jgi:hypothetical protein